MSVLQISPSTRLTRPKFVRFDNRCVDYRLRNARCGGVRDQEARERRNCAPLNVDVGITGGYGSEEGRRMANVRRLPPFQLRDKVRLFPATPT